MYLSNLSLSVSKRMRLWYSKMIIFFLDWTLSKTTNERIFASRNLNFSTRHNLRFAKHGVDADDCGLCLAAVVDYTDICHALS